MSTKSGNRERPRVGEVWVRRRDPRDGDGPRVRVRVASTSPAYRFPPMVEWEAIDPRRGQRRSGETEISGWMARYDREAVS